MADHQSHRENIESASRQAGIKDGVKQNVNNMLVESRDSVQNSQGVISGASQPIDAQYSNLEGHHRNEQKNQDELYNKEKTAQKLMPGADTPEELLEKAKELKNNQSK